ncbi:C13 family peptidase [Marinobacterium aestuariivivens]|uniref:C13 family peptidase n=1 Tax=Marinobacterium aestuariivivens TaxID=1698799 RepID=A0ABW2A291_9GAMM
MTVDELTEAPHPPEQRPSAIAGLVGNLAAGLRLVTGLRVGDVTVSLGQLVMLVLLLGVVEFTGAWLTTEPPALFDPYGLNFLGALLLFNLLILLLAGWLGGGDSGRFGRLLTGWLGASVWISAASWLLWGLQPRFGVSADGAWTIFYLLLIWQGLVVARLLRRFLGTAALRSLLLGAGYGLALLASLWLFPRSALFYTDYPDEAGGPEKMALDLDVERIFYAQPELMASSFEALAPQRPGVEDLYLLALGGYGLEDVFLNEVEYVRDQFDRRYGTAGRSLILANNPASVDRYPLASRPNLEESLAHIADRMDTDEDVLFLFMTSHGSADHRFSLEFGPVRLNDLTPQQIRRALDGAGIRWRVILVSSCYSGGFIEPLADPRTLVITAAAADRTSFGCGVDSDFTYFGTAYFKQALPEEPRFIQAFELANDWVSARENTEGLEPSQPQIYVGEAIAAKLASVYAEPALQAGIGGVAVPSEACADSSRSVLCAVE